MSIYKHIILTRFNVSMPGWNQKLNLSESWLDGRFDLFENMCLPSVVSQLNQNFTWLIMFDENTSNKHRERIKSLQLKYPFEAHFMGVFQLKDVTDYLKLKFQDTTSMLLTTRLDSDDILGTDFVQQIHLEVEKSTFTSNKLVFNFDKGAILYCKNHQYSLFEYVDKSNAFATLLEPLDQYFSTILAVKHTELSKFADVKAINTRPIWLQVVHGGNISNRVKGKRVNLNTYKTQFPYLQTINYQEAKWQILLDNYLFSLFRSLKELIRQVVKKIYFSFK